MSMIKLNMVYGDAMSKLKIFTHELPETILLYFFFSTAKASHGVT